MRKIAPFVFAVASLGLAGCASNQPEAATYGVRDQPPAYVRGFDDGCKSGYVAGGRAFVQRKKDMNQYGVERLYTTGWDDGFQQCKAEQDRMMSYYRR